MIPFDRLRPGDYATFSYGGNYFSGKLWLDGDKNLRLGPARIEDKFLDYISAERNNSLPKAVGTVITYTFNEGDSKTLVRIDENVWVGTDHGEVVKYDEDFLRVAGVWE